MQAKTGNNDWNHNAIIRFVVFLSIIIAAQHHFGLNFPVRDSFHYGEFLAAAMAVLHEAPFDGEPFTIHGAADIFPALAVNLFLSNPDYLISYTLIAYPIMSLLSVIIIIFAALKIMWKLGSDQILIIPFLLLVPFAIDWRDLFFALSLYIFVKLVTSGESQRRRFLMQILFGVVIALGTYWSFNRGAVALLAFGPITLWLALQDRRFLLSVGAALGSFLAIGLLLPGISVVGYIENFLMLLETSSQWRYPTSRFGQAWTVALLAALAASGVAGLAAVRRSGQDRYCLALIFALVVSSAVYVKIGLGRIDYVHLVMATWLPLLITSVSLRWGPVDLPMGWQRRSVIIMGVILSAVVLFYVMRSKHATVLLLATFLIVLGALMSPKGRFGVSVGVAVLIVAFAVSAPVVGVRKLLRGDFDWLVSLNVLPSNDIAVTEEVLWAAHRISESGAECIFDLANTGLVNAVAELPSCSRFTYPVYADQNFEDSLISDLIGSNPPVILYKSDFWSYAIDGRPMDERFPKLDTLIQRLYLREQCNLGVCLRYKE